MKEEPPRPEYMRRSSLPSELFVRQVFGFGSMSKKWYLRMVLKDDGYNQVSIYQDGGVYGNDTINLLSRNCPGATDAERYEHALRYVETNILLGEL